MKILKYFKVLILFLVVFIQSCSEKIYEAQPEFLQGIPASEFRDLSLEEYNNKVQGSDVGIPIYPEAKDIDEYYNKFKQVYSKRVIYNILCKRDISKKILKFYKKEFKKAGFKRYKKKDKYNRWFRSKDGKEVGTCLKWQKKNNPVRIKLSIHKFFNKKGDEIEKIVVGISHEQEFLPGIPMRSESGKKVKGGDVEIPVYSEARSRLFGKALESYLTRDYEQALILLRKLYKSAPDDKRIKSLYYASLGKLIIVHEEKQDYTIALNYIKEAEKIENDQHLKEIKKRILAKSSNELLEKKRDVH